MQVYSIPEEIGPAPDWLAERPGTFAEKMDAIESEETAHREALAQWLRDNGYSGPHTGKEYRTPRADGYARYMLADSGRGTGLKSALIHLPYGDGWHDPDVEFVPKREVLKRIKQQDNVAKIFAAKREKT